MVYRQFKVEIPEKAYVHRNGHVFVVTKPYPKNTRRVIGEACGEGKMHPCSHYFTMFQSDWKRQYPNYSAMIHQDSLGIGLFALVLGIGLSTGIYSLIVEAYGPTIANGIMDFVMYNLATSLNNASSFSSFMKNQMLFSITAYEDNWFSDLFQFKMNEQSNSIIRSNWIRTCINNGLTNVYLSIDGTNIDYTGKNNDLAQKGHSKSHNKAPIISSIWVICADGDHSGLPLTYFVGEGNVIDSKAFKRVYTFLQKFNLKIKGIIADRGFCNQDVFNALHEDDIDYVIMMKENTKGHQNVMQTYKSEIRENMEHVMEGGHKYGIVIKGKIISTLKFESNIVLIYDTMNGAALRDSFVSNAFKERDKWNEETKKGKDVEIPEKYKDIIYIDEETSEAHIDGHKVQEIIDSKGYYALGTSIEADAATIDEIYNLRNAAEKVFSEMKTSLDFGKIRSHSEPGVLNKHFCIFIAIIVRSEIMNSCKRHDLITRNVLLDASRLGFTYLDNQYDYVRRLSDKLAMVFNDFGLNDQSIESLNPIVDLRYKAEEGEKSDQEIRNIKLKNNRKPFSFKRGIDMDGNSHYDIGGDLNNYSSEGSSSESSPNNIDAYETSYHNKNDRKDIDKTDDDEKSSAQHSSDLDGCRKGSKKKRENPGAWKGKKEGKQK